MKKAYLYFVLVAASLGGVAPNGALAQTVTQTDSNLEEIVVTRIRARQREAIDINITDSKEFTNANVVQDTQSYRDAGRRYTVGARVRF